MSDENVLVGDETFLTVGRGTLPPIRRDLVMEQQNVTLVERQFATRACFKVVDGQRFPAVCSHTTHTRTSR